MVLRGFGKDQKIITRGYGGALIILYDNTFPSIAGGMFPVSKQKKTIEDLIQTKKIKLPEFDSMILVDVLLLNSNDVEFVVNAEFLTKKYSKIIVYPSNEVTYD